MSRYSIEGSTLTAIGDAIREKINKPTRIETFPVEQNTFIVSINPENIDVTQLSDKDKYGNVTQYWYYTQDIVVPGAVKFQVNYTFDTNLTDSYAVYAFQENGKTGSDGVFCNPNGTTSGDIVETYYNKVRIHVSINKTYWENKNYSYCDFEIIGLDVNENPVTEYEAEVINTLTPNQMAEEVQSMLFPPPEEAFIISGNCDYRFAYSGWDWFINLYSNKITTSNINSCKNMFANSNLSEIPFALNVRPVRTTDSIYFTYLFQSSKIKKVPYIYVSGVATPTTAGRSIGMDYMFAGCYYLKEIPYDFFNVMITDNDDFWDAVKNYGPNRNNMFANCYSLRELPDITNLNHKQEATYYYSYALYNNMLNGCASLNEVRNIPVADISISSSNCFGYCFDKCYRVKNITFATNEDGTPIVCAWKNQTIDLSKGSYNAVGFCGGGSSYESYITGYNSGITKDKKVTDDASYEALKNDPDWYSVSSDYGRYNHDSAVTTINSLPDVSAGSGNTIKFLGAAGAKTDGGAINTLTEEEIAVAAAKGWTVTLA